MQHNYTLQEKTNLGREKGEGVWVSGGRVLMQRPMKSQVSTKSYDAKLKKYVSCKPMISMFQLTFSTGQAVSILDVQSLNHW